MEMTNLQDMKRQKTINFVKEYKTFLESLIEKINKNIKNNIESIDFEDLLIKFIRLYKAKDFFNNLSNKATYELTFEDLKSELIKRFITFDKKEKEDIVLLIKNTLASISLDNDRCNNKHKEVSLINLEKQGYEFLLSEFEKLI